MAQTAKEIRFKTCPRCTTALPPEAFRKDANKPDGLDSYCKACRRKYTVANRPKECARWNRYRQNKGKEDLSEEDRIKRNARATAKRHHTEPKQCIVPRCTNRGERHHSQGYEGENAKIVIPLCRVHHALEHLLERARTATGPTYF